MKSLIVNKEDLKHNIIIIKEIAKDTGRLDNHKKILEFMDNERKNNPNITDDGNKIYYGLDCFTTYCMRHKKFMTKDMIYPLKKAKFENYEFLVPNKAEEYMKFEYPDYMEMPPFISLPSKAK